MISDKMMNNKLRNLLIELDEICNNNGIRYFLFEDTLVSALRHKKLPKSNKALTIAIYAKDVEKLVFAVDNNKNRAIESLLSNPEFPGFYLKYIDVNSTLYDVSDKYIKYKYYSIGINICVLYNNVGNKGLIQRVKHRIFGKWAKVVKRKKRSIKVKLFMTIMSLLNIKKTFQSLLMCKHVSNGLFVFLTDGKCVNLDSSQFGDGKQLIVDNYSFYVPEKSLDIALKIYDNNLLRKFPQNVIKKSELVSFSVSGAQFFETVNKNVNLKRCAKLYNRFRLWEKIKFKPVWNKRKEFYDYYYLSLDRFYYYQHLVVERKEEILEFYSQKNYEILYGMLRDYIKCLLKYNKREKGLYFDKEIYVIAIKTQLNHIRISEEIDTIVDEKSRLLINNIFYVPWQHLQPIEMLMKGDVANKEEMERLRLDIVEEIMKD